MDPNKIEIQTTYRIFSIRAIQGLMSGQTRIDGLVAANASRDFTSEGEARQWIDDNKTALARELGDIVILPTYSARHM